MILFAVWLACTIYALAGLCGLLWHGARWACGLNRAAKEPVRIWRVERDRPEPL
jgi:hypothetical protein